MIPPTMTPVWLPFRLDVLTAAGAENEVAVPPEFDASIDEDTILLKVGMGLKLVWAEDIVVELAPGDALALR
jgi:hypothetical protein